MNPPIRKSILVLEDDDTCRDLTRGILRAAGFHVLCARDFHEAIAIVEDDGQIDIALVDVKMPVGMPHGISFARMAQLRRPEMKIIFMSGNLEPEEYHLFDPGETFLHKPFAPRHLLELVDLAA
jgi:CheY-like chemotaxis protein